MRHEKESALLVLSLLYVSFVIAAFYEPQDGRLEPPGPPQSAKGFCVHRGSLVLPIALSPMFVLILIITCLPISGVAVWFYGKLFVLILLLYYSVSGVLLVLFLVLFFCSPIGSFLFTLFQGSFPELIFPVYVHVTGQLFAHP